KAAARLDDLLNLIPARLTSLLIVVAAPLGGGSPRRAWAVLRRDHGATASPNAGYPMSAMAGALDVRLEKLGHYCLNAEAAPPTSADIRRAARIVNGALALAWGVALLGESVWTTEIRRAERRGALDH